MNQNNRTYILLIVALVAIVGAVVWYMSVKNKQLTTTSGISTSTQIMASTTSSYYADTSTWQTDNRDDAGFSIKYPLDFQVDDNTNLTPVPNYRNSSQGLGVDALTLTIPKAFEPQTNFEEAKLVVAYSADTTEITDCLLPLQSGNPSPKSSTSTISGIPFRMDIVGNAGAGNIYDTTSYRTVYKGKCYAIEYTIHSTQLANYPASYGLTQFDSTKIINVLERILHTVSLK